MSSDGKEEGCPDIDGYSEGTWLGPEDGTWIGLVEVLGATETEGPYVGLLLGEVDMLG